MDHKQEPCCSRNVAASACLTAPVQICRHCVSWVQLQLQVAGRRTGRLVVFCQQSTLSQHIQWHHSLNHGTEVILLAPKELL